jgi:hypothetical protein
VSSLAELERELARGLGSGGLCVVEIPLEREANAAHHRALWSAAAAAVDEQRPA